MTNIATAQRHIEAVRSLGVEEFVVCAGSRNSPLLAVLSATPAVRLFHLFDERSAAFFALGRTKLRGLPVAVVTTSGTAVAELLPAAIEAHYSGAPLILMTADRPSRFRGTGAPQTIEQPGLFGPFATARLEEWSGKSPLHLNVEFDEPLIDASLDELNIEATAFPPSRAVRPIGRLPENSAEPVKIPWQRPLALVGGLADAEERNRVREFLLSLGAPVYAEPLSGLRECAALDHLLVRSERSLHAGAFEGVVRIGNVPAVRFWRDLEESLASIPVINFSALPFSGSSRGDVFPLTRLDPRVAAVTADQSFLTRDRALARRVETLVDEEPDSEPALFRRLSTAIPAGSRVYLGNSLPLREWDLAASRTDRFLLFDGNRGANGIDGQLSTFLGQADPTRMNVAVLGDLTALCDLNAPWIVPQLDAALQFQIIVINNGGGRIFSRVSSLASLDPEFRRRVIENDHDVDFRHWAAMWNLDFNVPDAARGVTEIRPDESATRRFWSRYDALWSEE